MYQSRIVTQGTTEDMRICQSEPVTPAPTLSRKPTIGDPQYPRNPRGRLGLAQLPFWDCTATDLPTNPSLCDPQMFGPFLSQFFIFLHYCFCVHVHIHMEIAMHTKFAYVCLHETLEYMMPNEAYIHRFMGFDQHWPRHHLNGLTGNSDADNDT